MTCQSLSQPLKKKEATIFDIFHQPDRGIHSPSTSNKSIIYIGICINHTKSVNADNHSICSTSEMLPAEADATEVETEPTTEHWNDALRLL